MRRNVLGDEEPARGVYADILAQLADGDRVAGALGHFDFLAVFDHADHLDKVDRERALRIAERGEGVLHTGDVGVVVGAPEIDEQRVAALDFIDVVGDIGRQVGESAVALAEDAVLVVTVVGALKPERAVLFVGETHIRHVLQAVVDALGVVLIEERLVHPALHRDAVGLEIAVDFFELLLLAVVHEVREALLRIGGEPLVALFLSELRGDALDVVGVVAALGQGVFLAEVLKIAGGERFAEHDDLVAGVVDIELTQHVPAAGLHHAGDAVAPGGVAGMAAVQIAGRVGGDPLEQQVLALAGIVLAVIVAGGDDIVDNGGECARLELEVDEAGAGDGDGFTLGQKLRELGNERLGDLHRVASESARQLHRNAGGIVTQLGVLRRLNDELAFHHVQIIDLFYGLLRGGVNLASKVVHSNTLLTLIYCRRMNASIHTSHYYIIKCPLCNPFLPKIVVQRRFSIDSTGDLW